MFFFSFTEHHQQHQNLLKAEEDLHFCDPLQSLLTLKFLPWKILAKRSRTSKITMHQLMTLTRINPKVRNVFYQLNDHYLKKNQLILIIETRKNINTEVEFSFSSYFTDTTIAVFLSIICTKNKILILKKKKSLIF